MYGVRHPTIVLVQSPLKASSGEGKQPQLNGESSVKAEADFAGDLTVIHWPQMFAETVM